MAEGISGIGAKLQRATTPTGSSYVDLALIKSIGGPDKTRDVLDTTTLGTTGGYRTFIAGLRKAGAIKANALFRRDAYDLMNADFESDVVRNYRIQLPDSTVTLLTFKGLVTELPLNVPADDVITVDFTIQISGQITVT